VKSLGNPDRYPCYTIGASELAGLSAEGFAEDVPFAQRMSANLGTTLQVADFDARAIDDIDTLVWTLDEPTPDVAAFAEALAREKEHERSIDLLRRAEHAPRIAIDDLRFPNEYEEMRRRGAVFVRLLPFAALRKDGWQGHVSESHWRTFKVHKEVNWNTREDLVAAAREFCPADYIGIEPSA
jgi:hypothetical protein